MLEAVVLAHLFLAVVTTIVIFRFDYFEKEQAILQAAIVWLVPLFGAVFVLIFQSVVHRNMTTKASPDAEALNNPDTEADSLYFELNSDD